MFWKLILHHDDTSNHFHITIETAPSLNKTKIYLSTFFSEFETFLIQKKSRQINFGFVQIRSSFNCNIKMVFLIIMMQDPFNENEH